VGPSAGVFWYGNWTVPGWFCGDPLLHLIRGGESNKGGISGRLSGLGVWLVNPSSSLPSPIPVATPAPIPHEAKGPPAGALEVLRRSPFVNQPVYSIGRNISSPMKGGDRLNVLPHRAPYNVDLLLLFQSWIILSCCPQFSSNFQSVLL
jgi:hypothetical protein